MSNLPEEVKVPIDYSEMSIFDKFLILSYYYYFLQQQNGREYKYTTLVTWISTL